MMTETKKIKKVTEPKKPRQKKISIKTIQAQEADINKLSTYVLNEENNEVIKYYKKFDEKKIQDLLIEAHAKMRYVAEHDEIDYFNNDGQFYEFLTYLTIKYFSHFYDELKESSFEEDIAAMNALVSTGLYRAILNDVFDGNEVNKVIEYMEEFIQSASLAIEAESKLRQSTLEQVQSPVIKKKLEENLPHRNVLN